MIVRLAWRSIWRNRRRTIITTISIGFGLAFALFFISFADGVYVQMINDGVRMQAGHVTIEHRDYRDAPAVDLYLAQSTPIRERIAKLPDVESTKLMLLGQGVAKTGLGTVGVAVIGVEPSSEARTSPLVKQIIDGRYLMDEDDALVVVGEKLAARLKLKVGKKLVLTTNDANGALTEELCRVAGIFKTGVDEIDGYLMQAPLSFLRRLYKLPPDGATQLGVVLKKPEAQKRVMSQIKPMLKDTPAAVYPWQEILPELASYVKLDKGSNVIFQAILMFLIFFTIFNTILMSILERQKEFAVLLAVGTRPSSLRGQILLESFFLGLIGTCLGLLVGGLASYALQVYGLDITKFYGEGVSISGFAISPIVHARLTPGLVLTVGGLVLAVTIILSLIPMRRATNISIADTLR